MTVKELKKYLDVMDDNAKLYFKYRDEADYGSEYCMRIPKVTSIEMGSNFVCFLSVEEEE